MIGMALMSEWLFVAGYCDTAKLMVSRTWTNVQLCIDVKALASQVRCEWSNLKSEYFETISHTGMSEANCQHIILVVWLLWTPIPLLTNIINSFLYDNNYNNNNNNCNTVHNVCWPKNPLPVLIIHCEKPKFIHQVWEVKHHK